MLKEICIEEFMVNKSNYDLIIDARSPKEYAHSHVKNAKNYFALSDEEHHEIGTIYKQSSRSLAKIKGASYICTNVAQHLFDIYKDYPLGSRIGIYCARGGLRSQSVAIILSGTGYQVHKVDKGYKSYRSYILQYLENFEHKNFITLGGNTGCGKSELLRQLSPSIDIEAMANHFGSTFGGVNGTQPSQKEFQNRVCEALQEIDKDAWIFVEGESKKLGSVVQPDLLYTRIHSSIRVEVTAPLEQRVQRILQDYINIDEKFFFTCMNHIKPYIGKKFFDDSVKAFAKSDLEKVAEILLISYYDKVYKKPTKIDYTIDTANFKNALDELKDIQKTLI
jgi:tRNA 2-selenouridine synthase